MTRTVLAAATAALVALSGGAFAQQVELVTGIGTGSDRIEAQTNAVVAWSMQAQRDYGDGNWNTAAVSQVQCFGPQGASGGGMQTMGIGVEIGSGIQWKCTVFGVPAAAIGG